MVINYSVIELEVAILAELHSGKSVCQKTLRKVENQLPQRLLIYHCHSHQSSKSDSVAMTARLLCARTSNDRLGVDVVEVRGISLTWSASHKKSSLVT